MSASTEALLESIKHIEARIAAATAGGRDPSVLKETLLKLQQQLTTANQALNEGKQALLKG
jgi:hypothetical protein